MKTQSSPEALTLVKKPMAINGKSAFVWALPHGTVATINNEIWARAPMYSYFIRSLTPDECDILGTVAVKAGALK